jgi:hypothetical protein
MLKQITVFLENKPGRLEEVVGYLAGENVNIHALSIADTTDFGILRIIVSDPGKAERLLKGKGLMVRAADVIAVAMSHSPGGLYKVLHELKTLDISIEYMYAFTSRHTEYDAIVILRLENQEAVLGKLTSSGIALLGLELLDRLNEGKRNKDISL